jgi:signal transduction histidine kinase/CheY-like chemotaxis protein
LSAPRPSSGDGLDALAERGALALQRQVKDLLAILQLGAEWRGRSEADVAAGLSAVLFELGRLDLVCVHFSDERSAIERCDPTELTWEEVTRALTDADPDGIGVVRLPRPNALGRESARIIAVTPQGSDHLVVAGSWREDFPTRHERLLLRAAADQAAHAVHLAGRARAEAALRDADARKDQFLAMLAHELRNPLAAISTALELARLHDVEASRHARTFHVVQRQSRHLTRLVDELLDVSRIARGKVQLDRRRLDVTKLVRETLDDLRAAFQAAGVVLTLELPAESAWVDGDETRLVQVVGNLVSNALKFTPSGGALRVTLRVDEGRVTAAFRDTGCGIEPRLLPVIFDAFVQGEHGLERGSGGLGLGLAVVKGIIQLHGGDVRIHSEGRGRGAEVAFGLPLVAAAAAPERVAAAPPSPSRLRVLVIDDNVDAATTLGELLEMCGHEVHVERSGGAGVLRARSTALDVVLCDLGLPGMDGLAVAAELRRHPETRALRLVAVTGYGRDIDRARTAEAGFDAHLTKPVELADLVRALVAGGGGVSRGVIGA